MDTNHVLTKSNIRQGTQNIVENHERSRILITRNHPGSAKRPDTSEVMRLCALRLQGVPRCAFGEIKHRRHQSFIRDPPRSSRRLKTTRPRLGQRPAWVRLAPRSRSRSFESAIHAAASSSMTNERYTLSAGLRPTLRWVFIQQEHPCDALPLQPTRPGSA
jgi:hypothetical protein